MHRRQAGLTLTEIIIAVAILAVLAAVAIPWYQGYVVEGRYGAARQDLRQMQIVFNDLASDRDLTSLDGDSTALRGVFQDSDGLIVLGGTNPASPPAGATAWLDPWESIYLYQRPNAARQDYTVQSYGPDGVNGTPGDDAEFDGPTN